MKYLKKSFVLIWILSSFQFALANPKDDFFRAIQQDDESRVIALALRGVDMNTVNAKGEHGLLLALRSGSLKVADFFLGQSGTWVEVRTPSGESPLMMAALKGHLAQARRLIARGAEVNKPGWTPLHYAATNTEPVSLELVRLLLDNHAYIDAESPNRSTPLMMAAHYGHPSVLKLLLEAGADPLLKNEQGLTAIDFARRAGRTDAAATIAGFVRSQQPSGRW
jgi:ankyrin repeat protein